LTHYSAKELENKAVLDIAAIMAAAARTAPKANGADAVDVAVVDGAEKDALANKMDELARQKQQPYPAHSYEVNSKDVRKANAVILIGVRGNRVDTDLPINCNACGFKTCDNLAKAGRQQSGDFIGPTCVMKALDLGIAVGSAVAIAGDFRVDNRIMYTIGVAAMKLKLLDSDVIMGIPLSISGKNPYYDRYYNKAPA